MAEKMMQSQQVTKRLEIASRLEEVRHRFLWTKSKHNSDILNSSGTENKESISQEAKLPSNQVGPQKQLNSILMRLEWMVNFIYIILIGAYHFYLWEMQQVPTPTKKHVLISIQNLLKAI